MKLYTSYIFVISISLSHSRKHDRSTSSESGSDGVSLYSNEHSTGLEKIMYQNKSLNLKGIMRQKFALEVSLQNVWGNVVCSPLSALMPVGKLALGAEDLAREELFSMIGVHKHEEMVDSFTKLIKDLKNLPGVKLVVASRLYLSNKLTVKNRFFNDIKEVFQSPVQKISFRKPSHAVNKINKWVKKQTDGRISDLLVINDIQPSSSMVIVNAIHFKGKWLYPFRSVTTEDFHTRTETKEVKMMTREGSYNYALCKTLKAQIIEIPYIGLKASFVIVLPLEKADLLKLLTTLVKNPEQLGETLKKLSRQAVKLSIPKFTIKTTLNLKDLYLKLGLNQIFQKDTGLTGILESGDLSISKAIQKVFIEVHENGTEAAAASAVVLLTLSAPINKPVTFKANHPFYYFLKIGTEVTFAGVFGKPD